MNLTESFEVLALQWGFAVGMTMTLLAIQTRFYTGIQAQLRPSTRRPLQTLEYQPWKHTLHLTPIPAWFSAYMTRVIYKIIYGTYTNSYILLG